MILCERYQFDILAGDVEAAFMQGDVQHGDQELYFHQPKEGLPGLEPHTLIKILKGVFGLATAPRQWWRKLRRLLEAVVLHDASGKPCHFRQHPLDPAFFYCHSSIGYVMAIAVVHVDDLLMGFDREAPKAKKAMHDLLPWGDWRELPFTFCGKSAFRNDKGELCLSQVDYARTIDPIEIPKSRRASPEVSATTMEVQDNRSALGALGWLATQSRPDLAANVATSQRNQANPTVGDLIETNRIIKLARTHAESCLVIPRLTGKLALVTLHDASWAHVDEEDNTGILNYVK